MLSEVSGEGRPLVLVPGALTGWLSWIPVAERLAPNRRVVRVQLLAVQLGLDGDSLPPDYSPKTEKIALGEALKALDLAPPVDFAAWSYGAAVTLDFALDHPEWVRTLTLIEPAAFWVLPILDAEAERQRDEDLRLSRDDITEDDLERFVRSVALVTPGSNPRDLPQWPVMVRHRQSLRAIPTGWAYRRDRRQLLELATPTLLVRGTGSAPLLHYVIDELAEQLPNAQVAEWPGGHAPHLVSMEPFLERMAAFQASAA